MILSCIGFITRGSAPKEPLYEGKKLFVWLDELAKLHSSKQRDPQTDQVQAIRAIGTNAIPWLLNELQVRGNRLHWDVSKLLAKQTFLKFRFPDVNDRFRRATVGFAALGELGEPAIPDLLKIVDRVPGYVPGVLAEIGPAAVPALAQCLTNATSFNTSAGQVAPIPGNTIGAIHNAINSGRLSISQVASLMPAIRSYAQSTNSNPAMYNYAADFLKEFDQ
jgi:hypothetical protein